MKVKFWQLPVLVAIGIVLLQNGMAEIPFGCTCKSYSNNPVDWFIVYKLPNSAQFYYLDANELNNWKKQPNFDMEGKDHAVFYTLQQIYGTKMNKGNFKYAMYSDQPPDEAQSPQNYGHSKGVIAWAKTGFWLIHSTPRFPPIRIEGYSWPPSAIKNAQIFLCISLQEGAYKSKIVDLLEKTYPDIYDSYGVEEIQHSNGEIKGVYMYSLGEKRFTIYAKPKTDIKDIYQHIAEKKHVNLLVQTWWQCNGIGMEVQLDTVYEVSNVAGINFLDFQCTHTKDHSKWAIGKTGTMICIGDLNRMESQFKRGGLVACFHHPQVSSIFKDMIIQLMSFKEIPT